MDDFFCTRWEKLCEGLGPDKAVWSPGEAVSHLAVKSIKANCLQLLIEFFSINKILPLEITE